MIRLIERSIKISGSSVRVVLPLDLVSSLGWYDGCHVQWRLGDNFLLVELTDKGTNSRVMRVYRSAGTKETLLVTVPIDFARTIGFREGDRAGFSLEGSSLKVIRVKKDEA